MYKKLNDMHKHKTVYTERVQYLDKSYRLSLLLKLGTLRIKPNHLANHYKQTLNDYKKIFSRKRYF